VSFFYPFNALLVPLIPSMAQYFMWLLGIAVGNIAACGEHWGKLPWSQKFKSPMRLFCGFWYSRRSH